MVQKCVSQKKEPKKNWLKNVCRIKKEKSQKIAQKMCVEKKDRAK